MIEIPGLWRVCIDPHQPLLIIEAPTAEEARAIIKGRGHTVDMVTPAWRPKVATKETLEWYECDNAGMGWGEFVGVYGS